jgi:hypothetical protein
LPPERLEIRIEPTAPTVRLFELVALGPRYEEALDKVTDQLRLQQ